MHYFVRLLLIMFVLFDAAAAQATSPSNNPLIAPGAGRAVFNQWSGKALAVYYYRPQSVKADTPVLFVMHGVKRNADDYRDAWLSYAEKAEAILVVPEFNNTDFAGSLSYNTGHIVDQQGRPRAQESWSFAAIEPMFDWVKQQTGSEVESYAIYGHSAGSQFVHRYVLMMPEARYHLAVAANAGWYTMADLEQDFPYGLKGTMVDQQGLAKAMNKPLIILLGTADTDSQNRYLRRTPEAMAQGEHRFARGHSFYNAGQAVAASLASPFAWQLKYVEDADHDDRKMSKVAAPLIFPVLVTK